MISELRALDVKESSAHFWADRESLCAPSVRFDAWPPTATGHPAVHRGARILGAGPAAGLRGRVDQERSSPSDPREPSTGLRLQDLPGVVRAPFPTCTLTIPPQFV